MKRSFICLLIALLFSLSGYAQGPSGSFSIRPEIGVSYSTFLANESVKTFTPSFGIVGGVEVEYQLSDRLALSSGILYTQEGAESKSGSMDYAIGFDYLNVPILLNYYFYKGIAFKLGVQPGYRVVSDWHGRDYNMRPIDVAGVAGISFEINRLVFDLRYNIGALDLQGNMSYDDRAFETSIYHSYVSFVVGYRFGK